MTSAWFWTHPLAMIDGADAGDAVGPTVVVFDLDGTLLDSDAALVRPFVALGVPEDEITFGHPVEIECRRLGLEVADYVDAYDVDEASPFPGVVEMLDALGEWSVCSNKARGSAVAELERLAWAPRVALFADDFGGRAKSLGPVLEALGASGAEVLFVGDTDHDRRCALEVGARFAWAGWNPRTLAGSPGGVVLERPVDVLGLLDRDFLEGDLLRDRSAD